MNRQSAIALVALAATAAIGCGVDAREYSPLRNPTLTLKAAEVAKQEQEAFEDFSWPEPAPELAVIHIAGYGDVTLELYPDLAPETAAHFLKLANDGFYDGTTFHRVIPKFMVQGGDPNSRDDDPQNDGRGGPGYTLPDEFSGAPHDRGVVAMANSGGANSAGSQFFIVQKKSYFLNHKYTVFGRVISGMDKIDSVVTVERDVHGRWGPKDRPLEDVVIERVWTEPAGNEFASHE